MPQDFEKLKQDAETYPKFVAKPIFGGQGKGIRLFNASSVESISREGDYLIQKYSFIMLFLNVILIFFFRYILNPFLINDRKFTVRIYPLITSLDPLRIYLSRNGIVKFAAKK